MDTFQIIEIELMHPLTQETVKGVFFGKSVLMPEEFLQLLNTPGITASALLGKSPKFSEPLSIVDLSQHSDFLEFSDALQQQVDAID